MDLAQPPAALYVRGELPRGPAVAVVGTRSATAEGLRFAHDLARELAAAGVSVLSGGAAGIDTAAHRGALAARGSTVVIAPAGYDAAYPPDNAALFRRVVKQGGAYVSLVPDDQAATRAAFFARNECLVALAHAVVVVQAGVRSGARNAAACARRLGRPLFAVPSGPWVARGRGCLLELRLGALLCEGAVDVLRLLERSGFALIAKKRGISARHRPVSGPKRSPGPVTERRADHRSPGESGARVVAGASAEEQLLNAVRAGCQHPDELCVMLGWPAARVHALVLTLELRGVLVPGQPGRILVAKPAD